MATAELDDLIEAFKREVAVPGTFAATFPTTSDSDITAALADAFAQAQLDGFFPTHVLDVAAATVEPELSTAGTALVVVYAGIRTLRARLATTKTRSNYVAKGVQYEVEQGASVLAGLLTDLAARRTQLLALAARGARGAASTVVFDGYMGRVMDPGALGGFAPAELGFIAGRAVG